MRCCIQANERAEHQKSYGGAFAEGMRKHGWEVVVNDRSQHYDMFVRWGVGAPDQIREARRIGAKVVILERGYIGDRMRQYTSVSLGGELNGRATFGPCQDNGERFNSIAKLEPWQTGRKAIILGQCHGDNSVKGWDLTATYQKMHRELTARGWDVVYRPHPLRPVGLPGIPTQDTQAHKEPDFTDCGLAVTISSNSGVLSVLSGVPTVALDDRSMAWDVTARDYEAVTPDRTQWAHHLAWKQWTRDEIANGDAWDALKGLN